MFTEVEVTRGQAAIQRQLASRWRNLQRVCSLIVYDLTSWLCRYIASPESTVPSTECVSLSNT